MQVLVIEDDPVLGKALQRGMNDGGHTCDWVRNGQKGLDEACTQRFDAVVLDLLLPDLAGIEIMKSLRSRGILTPVLILTALGSVDDRARDSMYVYCRSLNEVSSSNPRYWNSALW